MSNTDVVYSKPCTDGFTYEHHRHFPAAQIFSFQLLCERGLLTRGFNNCQLACIWRTLRLQCLKSLLNPSSDGDPYLLLVI